MLYVVPELDCRAPVEGALHITKHVSVGVLITVHGHTTLWRIPDISEELLLMSVKLKRDVVPENRRPGSGFTMHTWQEKEKKTHISNS